MCHRVHTTMRCEPASVPAARHWAAQHLVEMYGQLDDGAGDAELIVSELVGNCVRAHAHQVDIALDGHHDHIRVEATDDAPGRPVLRNAAPTDPTGRGLLIVDTLSTAWGVEPAPHGKRVWTELALAPDVVATFDCSRPLTGTT